MNIKIISDKIYWIDYTTQEEVAKAFLRPQEYYEHPIFKDRIFSLDEFKEYYKTHSPTGEFTYYKDWGGFNVPSEALRPFLVGLFDPLSLDEYNLIHSLLGHVTDPQEDFYVIGTFGGGVDELEHEIVHAMFTTNVDYRNAVLDVVKQHTLDTRLIDMLRIILQMNYDSSVMVDEANAYITTGLVGDMQVNPLLAEKLIKLKEKYWSTDVKL